MSKIFQSVLFVIAITLSLNTASAMFYQDNQQMLSQTNTGKLTPTLSQVKQHGLYKKFPLQINKNKIVVQRSVTPTHKAPAKITAPIKQVVKPVAPVQKKDSSSPAVHPAPKAPIKITAPVKQSTKPTKVAPVQKKPVIKAPVAPFYSTQQNPKSKVQADAPSQAIDAIPLDDVQSFLRQCNLIVGNTETKELDVTGRCDAKKKSNLRIFEVKKGNDEFIVKVEQNHVKDGQKPKASQTLKAMQDASKKTDWNEEIPKILILPKFYGVYRNNNLVCVKKIDNFNEGEIQDNDVIFTFMEKAKGDKINLSDVNFFTNSAVKFAGEYGKALGILHKNGIYHGDIDGNNNIFFDGNNVSFIDYSPGTTSWSIKGELMTALLRITPYPDKILSPYKEKSTDTDLFQIDTDIFESFLKEYTAKIGKISMDNCIPEKLDYAFRHALMYRTSYRDKLNDASFMKDITDQYIDSTQKVKKYLTPYTKREIAREISEANERKKEGKLYDYYQARLCLEKILYSEHSEDEIRRLIMANCDVAIRDDNYSWLKYIRSKYL